VAAVVVAETAVDAAAVAVVEIAADAVSKPFASVAY